eukprot:166991_1
MISQFMMNSKVVLAISILALILMPVMHADRGHDHGLGRYGKKRSCCSEFEASSGDAGMDALAKSFVENFFGVESESLQPIHFSDKVGFCGGAKEFGNLTCAPLCCRCCQSLTVDSFPSNDISPLSDPDIYLCYETDQDVPVAFLQSGNLRLDALVVTDPFGDAYAEIKTAYDAMCAFDCDSIIVEDDMQTSDGGCYAMVSFFSNVLRDHKDLLETSDCGKVSQDYPDANSDVYEMCDLNSNNCRDWQPKRLGAVAQLLVSISECSSISIEGNYPLNVHCPTCSRCQN